MTQRQKVGFQDWNTPAEVLDPLQEFLPITLDPCSNPTSIVPAAVKIALPDDGLYVPWHQYGHTYFNPPYADQPFWLFKAAVERILFGALTITAIVPASTETTAFREYGFGTANAIAFWKRRIRFLAADGSGKSGNSLPSALVYWGDEADRFAEHFKRDATVITGWTK